MSNADKMSGLRIPKAEVAKAKSTELTTQPSEIYNKIELLIKGKKINEAEQALKNTEFSTYSVVNIINDIGENSTYPKIIVELNGNRQKINLITAVYFEDGQSFIP